MVEVYQFPIARPKVFQPFRQHFTGHIASIIRSVVNNITTVVIDQHQQNAMWGVHQMRVRFPNDPITYRLILAPENAPISVGRDNPIPINQHFLEPING